MMPMSRLRISNGIYSMINRIRKAGEPLFPDWLSRAYRIEPSFYQGPEDEIKYYQSPKVLIRSNLFDEDSKVILKPADKDKEGSKNGLPKA